jgi:hypothetical protein
LGAFLTVPFPGNDHTINPDSVIEKYYLDYGPLLNEIKGREWVLIPEVIEVVDNTAKANIFTVNGNLIIPVIHGKEKNATVIVRLPDTFFTNKKFEVQALYPGKKEWEKISKLKYANEIKLLVPLQRGCALVKISAL